MYVMTVISMVCAWVFAPMPIGEISVQATEATLEASPVAAEGVWQVTDARAIAAEGEPIALSPDGQWLAGTAGDGNQVCAWNIDTLTPACAEVGMPVRPYIGNAAMRWAPDSSAFAFVSGDFARVIPMDVHVFEVATGNLTNLTRTGDSDDGPLYLGATWTSDSQEVVFGVNYGLGGSLPADVVRVDRSGGEPVKVPLPSWTPSEYEIFFPPLVGNDDAVFVSIHSEAEFGGVWRVGLDGSDPEQMVSVTGENPVETPFAASASPDGRYLNIVSLRRFQTARSEGTFLLLDIASGDLTPLDAEDAFPLISFSQDGDAGLTVGDIDGEDRLHILNLVTGDTTPVTNSPAVRAWLMNIPDWAANDTVFLPGDGGGTLITLQRGG